MVGILFGAIVPDYHCNSLLTVGVFRFSPFPLLFFSPRRVLDIFAPSLALSPYTDTLEKDYPFSAK